MARMLDAVLPEGSAVRDFVEVGGLLASGVSIALVCSSIGGVVMDTFGFLATLVLFFAAGFFFLTSKARPTPSAPARDVCVLCGAACDVHARDNGSSMQVLKGNDNKAVHVQILFSTVFMISCSMFSLVLFEGGRILTQGGCWELSNRNHKGICSHQ